MTGLSTVLCLRTAVDNFALYSFELKLFEFLSFELNDLSSSTEYSSPSYSSEDIFDRGAPDIFDLPPVDIFDRGVSPTSSSSPVPPRACSRSRPSSGEKSYSLVICPLPGAFRSRVMSR